MAKLIEEVLKMLRENPTTNPKYDPLENPELDIKSNPFLDPNENLELNPKYNLSLNPKHNPNYIQEEYRLLKKYLGKYLIENEQLLAQAHVREQEDSNHTTQKN